MQHTDNAGNRDHGQIQFATTEDLATLRKLASECIKTLELDVTKVNIIGKESFMRKTHEIVIINKSTNKSASFRAKLPYVAMDDIVKVLSRGLT